MASAPFPLPLTPYERFMWRNDRPGYPVVWSVWLELLGALDERLLDEALAQTIEWHPFLAAVVSGRGRKARWTFASSVRHRVEWMADSRSPIELPDISREPGLRIVGSKRGDNAALVFHFNHASCDGVGGIQFLGDLFASYSQLVAGESRAAPVRSLDIQTLGDRYRSTRFASLGQRLGHGARLAAWFPKGLAFRPSVLAPAPGRAGKTSPPDAHALFRLPEVRLRGEQVAALRAQARGAGASVNDLLLAEALLAVQRWNADNGGGRRIRLLMPTNQRRPDQAETPAANIVGFEPIDLVVDDSTEWGNVLAQVRDRTAAVKKLRQPSLMDDWMAILAAAPPLLDGLLSFPSALYTGIVSNLGAPADHFWSHLPQEDGKVLVGEARLEGIGFAPPIRPRSAISLGVTSYGGQLSITGKACPRTVGAPGLARFLERLGEQFQARTAEPEAQPVGSPG